MPSKSFDNSLTWYVDLAGTRERGRDYMRYASAIIDEIKVREPVRFFNSVFRLPDHDKVNQEFKQYLLRR